MIVVDASFGYLLPLEEKAAAPLAGGIANMGDQCGMLCGAALATGAQAYRLFGPGPVVGTGQSGTAYDHLLCRYHLSSCEPR